MTKYLLIPMLVLSLRSVAQKVDSPKVVHDTAYIALIPVVDTSKVTITYKGPGHTVLYEDGYYLVFGLKKSLKENFVKTTGESLLDNKRKAFVGIPIRIDPRQ